MLCGKDPCGSNAALSLGNRAEMIAIGSYAMPTTILRAQATRGQTTGRVDPESHGRLWTLSASLEELQKWIERSAQRTALHELAEYNGHLLHDIGKSKAEALQEAAKPFWRR